MKNFTKAVIETAIQEQESIMKRAEQRRTEYLTAVGNEDRLIRDCKDNIDNLKKDLEE